LHLRPELDLAKAEDRLLFTAVAEEVSDLVKHFNGSLSGEHGDGRLRGPFLEKMVGAELYKAHLDIKKAFDPESIFNPGKILTKEPIDQSLRVTNRELQWQGRTGFDWSGDLGLPAVVDKCNGVAVCRKSAGDGTLCPSYHATGEELYNTRGRSNLLRFLLHSGRDFKKELLNPALVKSMDFCLSCKACQSECPASVDMARLKAEYLYQRRLGHGLTFKDRMVLLYPHYLRLASKLPALANRLQATTVFKKMAGVSSQRELPLIAEKPFVNSVQRNVSKAMDSTHVILLVDFFSQYQSPEVPRDALRFLETLGFVVHPVLMKTSPRQLISQGLLAEGKIALQQLLAQINSVSGHYDILGLEPSELLVLRDELVDLVLGSEKDQALQIKARAFLLEEFLAQKVLDNRVMGDLFKMKLKKEPVMVAIHNHCHQKSLVGPEPTKTLFEAMQGVQFKLLNTGCCGMAGQFGYENTQLSEKVAKTSFLPEISQLAEKSILIASGCSCRAQAAILAGVQAVHPATFLVKRLSRL
jgi:Fe-S oxidoreductase